MRECCSQAQVRTMSFIIAESTTVRRFNLLPFEESYADS